MARRTLKDSLAGIGTTPDEITRGHGLTISSEDAKTQNRNTAKAQNGSTAKAPPKRVSRGYMLDEELIQRLRFTALKKRRRLYEVMEEAIAQYLERCDSEDGAA